MPSWATDGGADVTDPGTSKQATGWIEGEAPAADHTNWLLNQQGAALDFYQQTLAPWIAHSNMHRTDSAKWGALASRHIGQYLPALDRHYVIQHDSDNDADAWDSADGITWSSATEIDPGAGFISQFCDDGTDLFVGVANNLYKSTTGLVTNLTYYADLPGNVHAGLVYDKVNGYFIMAGGSNDIYYSATGATGTWTSYTTPTSNMKAIAHDPNTGRTIVYEDTTFDFYYSDNATTWTPYSAATDYDYVIYSQGCGCFIGSASDQSIYKSETGSAAWLDTGLQAGVLIDTPDFLLAWDDVGNTWRALRNSPDTAANTLTVIELGGTTFSSEVMTYAYADVKSHHSCGGGVLFFPWGTHQLAYSQYGPST